MVRYVVFTGAPTSAEVQRSSESGNSREDDPLVWHVLHDELNTDVQATQPCDTRSPRRQSTTLTPPYHVLSKNLEVLVSLPRGTLSRDMELHCGDDHAEPKSWADPTSPVDAELQSSNHDGDDCAPTVLLCARSPKCLTRRPLQRRFCLVHHATSHSVFPLHPFDGCSCGDR
jgi:hypothetical protein